MALLKRRLPSPVKKKYRDYKPFLREDFSYQCVYCKIHENEYGGPLHYHVEHFKPKSLFPKLNTDYTNLLYSCDACNMNKSDDWPSDNPVKVGRGYIDPCQHDYNRHFSYDKGTFQVQGRTRVARYMIDHLFLNREQLKTVRRLRSEREASDRELLKQWNVTLATIREKLKSPGLTDAQRTELKDYRKTLRAMRKQHLERIRDRWKPLFDLDGYRG